MRLGTPLDPEAVREGTDLYFDCIVSAHPPVYKVEWRHNVSIILLLLLFLCVEKMRKNKIKINGQMTKKEKALKEDLRQCLRYFSFF